MFLCHSEAECHSNLIPGRAGGRAGGQVHTALIPEHRAARRLLPAEFQAMQTKGVVSGRLLGVLWESCAHPEAVRQLMVSLGLMVPILARDDRPDPDADEFLVLRARARPSPPRPRGPICPAWAPSAPPEALFRPRPHRTGGPCNRRVGTRDSASSELSESLSCTSATRG